MGSGSTSEEDEEAADKGGEPARASGGELLLLFDLGASFVGAVAEVVAESSSLEPKSTNWSRERAEGAGLELLDDSLEGGCSLAEVRSPRRLADEMPT